jgi:hypothetical protein
MGEWLGWLFAVSVVMFIGSLLAVPWLIVRMPHDYFSRPKRIRGEKLGPVAGHPLVRLILVVLKNVSGVILLLAGFAMLFLPGQGLLTLFLGLVLIDFPGKYRVERYIVSRPAILKGLNWIRQRHGERPLELG